MSQRSITSSMELIRKTFRHDRLKINRAVLNAQNIKEEEKIKMMNEKINEIQQFENNGVLEVTKAKNAITINLSWFKVVIMCIFCLIIGIGVGIVYERLRTIDQQVEYKIYLRDKLESYEKNDSIQKTKITDLETEVEHLNNTIKEKDIKTEELQEKLSVLEMRSELYDKYEYIINVGGNRTDLTYDQIKLGEDLMNEKGINPHLLFGVIYTESRGTQQAASSRSSARGYGQFIASTGKVIYENFLGYGPGTYDHSLAYDGNINIQMTVAYLDYLMKNANGNAYIALKNYNGGELSTEYAYRVNNLLVSNGKPSLTQIHNEYNS